MLLIVDANCALSTLSAAPHADYQPVLDALLTGRRKLAIGGSKQKIEYQRLAAVWRFVRSLDQAGRARLIPDSKVDEEELLVKQRLDMASDDPHILALARISGARLLCSHDQALHADFCNGQIISNPRGKVYQNASHARLLR